MNEPNTPNNTQVKPVINNNNDNQKRKSNAKVSETKNTKPEISKKR